eukprot:2548975-Rhodomonas_salina.1
MSYGLPTRVEESLIDISRLMAMPRSPSLTTSSAPRKIQHEGHINNRVNSQESKTRDHFLCTAWNRQVSLASNFALCTLRFRVRGARGKGWTAREIDVESARQSDCPPGIHIDFAPAHWQVHRERARDALTPLRRHQPERAGQPRLLTTHPIPTKL